MTSSHDERALFEVGHREGPGAGIVADVARCGDT